MKGFGRLIVFSVLMLPYTLIDSIATSKDVKGPFEAFFYLSFIPAFLVGFVLCSFSDKINTILYLDDRLLVCLENNARQNKKNLLNDPKSEDS